LLETTDFPLLIREDCSLNSYNVDQRGGFLWQRERRRVQRKEKTEKGKEGVIVTSADFLSAAVYLSVRALNWIRSCFDFSSSTSQSRSQEGNEEKLRNEGLEPKKISLSRASF